MFSVFGPGNRLDPQVYDELEEALIAADVGPATSMKLVDEIRQQAEANRGESVDPQSLLKDAIERLLCEAPIADHAVAERVRCVLVVGVNGVGKTTTIAKLAKLHKESGKKVLLAAADTFRAAAIEQLETWARRVGCDIVKHQHGSDPAAVVFDALSAARAREADVVIVDTAGRLHTKVNLMNELKKIHRVISKEMPDAMVETLLVLDANTGQNALQQARVFAEATAVSAIAITKLDSTAKGGMVLSIVAELRIPIKYIATGETLDDIAPFEPAAFAQALLK